MSFSLPSIAACGPLPPRPASGVRSSLLALGWLVTMTASPGCAPTHEAPVDDTGTTTDDTGSTTAPDPTSTSSGTDTESAGIDDTSESGDTTGDPSCGDGRHDEAAGEQCDDAGESATCDADCTDVVCGDMTINVAAGEECDGIDLAGATCQTLGFSAGTLACGGGCSYDTRGCGNLPAAPVLSLDFSTIKQFDFAWAAVDGAAYYRLEESAAPGEPFVPLGGDLVGESLSLTMPLHLRYQASYRLQACNDGGCTSSAVVDVTSSLADAVGYVKASNTEESDSFGSVVALSGDGNTLAIGTIDESSSATGIDGDQNDEQAYAAGAVYVFTRDPAGTWAQQAYIKASNTDEGDQFGGSVALSHDGSTLAVGAVGESSNATGIDGDQANELANSAGAVYVFQRDALEGWSQAAYVKTSNTDPYDRFGTSVSLSDDGNTLAVGAESEGSNATGIDGDQANDSLLGAGAVYVFDRDGMGAWSQAAYVKASNPDVLDTFGIGVALSGDGDTLAVGAVWESSNATGIDGNQANDSADSAGAVYVFARDGSGAWSQQAYVKASNTDAEDFFGSVVALSDDGDTLAVGAFWESSAATGIDGDQADDSASHAGAVYVFARDGMGAWSQAAYVKASNTDAEDFFGARLGLSGDGNTLAVGAYAEDGSGTGLDGDQADDSTSHAGAVYVFVRDGMGAWSQRAYVKAPNTGESDTFGAGLGLSGDGRTLAVGAIGESSSATGIGGDQTSDAAVYAGAVYLY